MADFSKFFPILMKHEGGSKFTNISGDKGYIYKITNPVGRIYIGQTVDIRKRRNSYSSRQCKDQPAIYNSITKHGWENHKFDIIDTFQSSEFLIELLNSAEVYWIGFYKSKKEGLNCTNGGGGSKGFKHTKESVEKIRKIQTGKILPISHRRNISKGLCRRVYCNETNIVYTSAKEAADVLQLTPGSVTRVCKGEYGHTKGFTFKYHKHG